MTTKEAIVARIQELCNLKSINQNELANLAGVTPSTVYSLFDPRRNDVSISTIKKLCDGLDLTLGAFFNAPVFDALEQEIK